MSLIAAITTLRVEDFPDQLQWIGTLLNPVNQFFTETAQAINGNIVHGQNIPCQTQVLNFAYGGANDFPKSFKYTLTQKPVELRVCQATENAFPIAVVCPWSFANGQITISNFYKITGTSSTALTVGATYNIVVRALP